jgi:hypothetical protein
VAGRTEKGAPASSASGSNAWRRRPGSAGLRTLDLFLSELIKAGGRLPENLVLTLPKVSTVDQVRAMVLAARALEAEHSLGEGTITFEIQVETPQLVLAADGTVPLATALQAGAGSRDLAALRNV